MSPDGPSSRHEREEAFGADQSQTPGPAPLADPDPRDPDAAALRAVAEAIVKEFPLVSEDSALVLYEVDPEHLQAQWQLNARDLERARGLFPSEARAAVRAELRLRRIRADHAAELVTSVPCNLAAPDFAAGARFSLRNDTAQYETELGLASEDGGWVALVRSNRTRLPPLVPEGFPKGEGAVESALAAVGHPLHPVFPNPLDLGEDPTGPEASRATSASFASTAGEAESARVGEVSTQPGEWARLPPPLLPSSVPEGQQDFPLYDPRTALSSRAIQDLPAADGDLVLQAELLIYGRATPGQEIGLFGHRLQVGPKGYFFLRRAVDDPGILELALSDLPARLPEGLLSE
jgi:hypothetical protein